MCFVALCFFNKFYTFAVENGAGIFSIKVCHPLAISLAYGARIFKRLWSPGIDSKERIPPAYVTWRAGTITLFLLGS